MKERKKQEIGKRSGKPFKVVWAAMESNGHKQGQENSVCCFYYMITGSLVTDATAIL